MKGNIKPLLKWTGGKYREFAFFEDKIPEFNRYVEPFFGGGGVFFALQPQRPSFINDKSKDLIQFYSLLNNSTFKNELYRYTTAWEQITELSNQLWHKYQDFFIKAFNAKSVEGEMKNKIISLFSNDLAKFSLLIDDEFTVSSYRLEKSLAYSLLDKLNRIQKIIIKENRRFLQNELQDHFETAIKSGLYLYFRTLMNENAKNEFLSKEKATANWYFVREFCYASMFRFNAKGEFNIPYGGIAYNKKNFKHKVDAIFNLKTQILFANTMVYNLDFEEFLLQIELKKQDFVFLDPPYDSEFSEYDQNAFTQNDQKRLAKFLINCVAKWMVVIKETPFIREIYQHPKVNISTFDKNYTYNVRGRNNREVKHLIITNY